MNSPILRICPKCKGTGDIGQIKTYLCDICGGKGKIGIQTADDNARYRRLCKLHGTPEDEEITEKG